MRFCQKSSWACGVLKVSMVSSKSTGEVSVGEVHGVKLGH